MGDRDLQRARRVAVLGDPQAVARLLRELLRAGQLSRERVAVAAYAGDCAASMALGQSGPPAVASWEAPRGRGKSDLDEWLSGLAKLGTEALLRAGLAASAEALEAWEGELHAAGCASGPDWSDVEDERAQLPCPGCGTLIEATSRVAFRAAEDWFRCPCASHVDRCMQIHNRLPYRADRPGGRWQGSLLRVARQVSLEVDPVTTRSLRRLFVSAGEDATPPQVHVAVRTELAAWSLWGRDPVRERVAKRTVGELKDRAE